MLEHGVQELARLLATRQLSSVELTEYYLERIERLDERYNCFISLSGEEARAQAAAADARRAAGTVSPLCGIPLAHKDIYCTQGVRTSCASRMLDNFVPPYDATVVAACRQAGAVMLGKTNMDEFAMGSSNENSSYGAVRNPWDLTRVPGGSSGGSAAAVAARLTPLATGTDTGGSLRQPAALCGVTALKPTYGRVSRHGMIAFASSLDQGGPVARDAADAALLLEAMAGFDPRDSTSEDRPVPQYHAALEDSLAGVRIGLPQEYFNERLAPEAADAVHQAAREYERLGARLKEIQLPHTHLAVPVYYILAPAECSANLARYDGVRYGHRCDQPAGMQDLYMRTRSEAFGEEVKRRILVGTYVLSRGYYDAYYVQAQKVRRLIREDFRSAFADVDLILAPCAPGAAFPLGEKAADPISMYYQDEHTLGASLAGLPALAMPGGFADGLPLGVQLIAPDFAEGALLTAAHRFQQATSWHLQRPPETGGEAP